MISCWIFSTSLGTECFVSVDFVFFVGVGCVVRNTLVRALWSSASFSAWRSVAGNVVLTCFQGVGLAGILSSVETSGDQTSSDKVLHGGKRVPSVATISASQAAAKDIFRGVHDVCCPL